MLRFLTRLLISNLFSLHCLAQGQIADSNIHYIALDDYQSYMSSIGGASHLYNGPEYTGSYPGVMGHPFFSSDSFQRGFISYDHVLYLNVSMEYDLASNELVIKGYQDLNIALINRRIDSFFVADHLFVLIDSDSTSTIPTDLYDVIYNGKIKALVKRKKVIDHSFHGDEALRFKEYNDYYIKMDDKFYKIEDKNAMIFLFKNKAKEVSSYWKQNRLNYKKNPEKAIVSLVGYYDQLRR